MSSECVLSTFPPDHDHKALKFCHIFPGDSCCLPVQDSEIEEHYFNLLDAGDICAKQSSQAKDALRRIFCFGCDPNTVSGGASLVEDSNGYSLLRICPKIAEEVDPVNFDDCGMVRVAGRGDLCDGDDTVIPSGQWPKCDPGQVSYMNLQLQIGFGFGLGTQDFAGDMVPDDLEPDYGTCWDISNTPVSATGLVVPDGSMRDGNALDDNSFLSDVGVIGCVDEIDPNLPNDPHNDYSCTGYYKFLNDDSGGKPPYFEEDYLVIVQECSQEVNAGRLCTVTTNEECFRGGASQASISSIAIFFPFVVTLLSVFRQ